MPSVSTFDAIKSDPKIARAQALRRAMLTYLKSRMLIQLFGDASRRRRGSAQIALPYAANVVLQGHVTPLGRPRFDPPAVSIAPSSSQGDTPKFREAACRVEVARTFGRDAHETLMSAGTRLYVIGCGTRSSRRTNRAVSVLIADPQRSFGYAAASRFGTSGI
jgi:hypothetical protein